MAAQRLEDGRPGSGKKFLIPPTRAELKTAVDTAAAVGGNIYESAGMKAKSGVLHHGSSRPSGPEWRHEGYEEESSETATWSASAPRCLPVAHPTGRARRAALASMGDAKRRSVSKRTASRMRATARWG